LLNNQIRARGFFRTMFYLPVVTPLVIASIIWKWVYNGDYGLLNYYLIKIHVIDEPLLWLADPKPGDALRDHHQCLEGRRIRDGRLSRRPAVDSGGLLRRCQARRCHRVAPSADITIPLLSSTTLFLLVISILGSFQVFTQIFIMTNGGPLGRTRTVVWYIYTTAFKDYNMGYASALAFALFAMMLVFTLLQFRFLRREVEY
jgi:multiple sugar transport system permease protein